MSEMLNQLENQLQSQKFNIDSAIAVQEGEGGLTRAQELDVHTSQGVQTDESGMTGYDLFVKHQMDQQVHAGIHQPLTDSQVRFIEDQEAEDPGVFQSFMVPYTEGVVGFVSKLAGYRPDLSRPFGLTKGPKTAEEQSQDQAMATKQPVAYTLGQVVSGTAPFIATAPIFPMGLLGTLATFETVGLSTKVGQIMTEESLLMPTGKKLQELGIEAIKSGIMAPVWYYSAALKFIGRPFLSAISRAGVRGAGQATLSAVFGTDLASAFKEGGVITALSLIFESPILAKTALGRGILNKANTNLTQYYNQMGYERPVELQKIVPGGIDAWDAMTTKKSVFQLIKGLYNVMAPRMAKMQAENASRSEYNPYARFLAQPKSPGPAVATNAPSEGVGQPKTDQPIAGGLPAQNMPVPVFYSKLMATIAEKMPEAATPAQIYGIIKSSGISPDEVEISGIDQLMHKHLDPVLPENHTVPKAEVLEFLRNNQLQIDETMLGGEGEAVNVSVALSSPEARELKEKYGWQAETNPEDPGVVAFLDPETGDIYTSSDLEEGGYSDPGGNIKRLMRAIEQKAKSTMESTKYGRYTVPGGENYRELLLKVPDTERKITEVVERQVGGENKNNFTGIPLEQRSVEISSRVTVEGQGGHARWEEFQKRITHKTFNILKGLEEFKNVTWQDGYFFPYNVGTRSTQKVVVVGFDREGKRYVYYRNPAQLTGPGSVKIYIDGRAWKVGDVLGDNHPDYPQERLPGATKSVVVTKSAPGSEPFVASHWGGEKNVFAHGRMKDRETADGKSVLFIEETQSDWNLALRGKGEKARAHPIVKKWLEVLLKRILRQAAAEGKDYVAWASGKQTAEHYNLAKYVDEIQWVTYGKVEGGKIGVSIDAIRGGNKIISKTVPIDELEDLIGKDAAGKIKADIENKVKKSVLTGEDLQVGGHWAINLYDRTIPQFMNDFGKKFGAQVEIIDITTETKRGDIKIDGEYPVPAADFVKNVNDMDSAAITRKVAEDLKSQLPPGVRITDIKFSETDSGNITHAVAYYHVALEGPADQIIKVAYDPEYDAESAGILTVEGLKEQMEKIEESEGRLIQQALPITPAMKQALLYEGQPLLGKMPVEVGKPGAKTVKAWEYIFRMSEKVEVINTKGEKVILPKGEEYHTMPVMDADGNPVPGKVKLQDGKQVTIYEGELNKLKGLRIPTPGAGGMTHDLPDDIPEITKKDFNQPKKPLPEDQVIADQGLIDKLNTMQAMLGKHLVISSGYRTQEYNDWLRTPEGGGYATDPKSIHMSGQAADIDVKLSGLTHEEIVAAAQEAGLDVEDIGLTKKHVHVEIPQGGTSPTKLMEGRPETPEEIQAREDFNKEIESETEQLKDQLKDYLTEKLKPELENQGEYADLKHLSWLFAGLGEKGYTPDELVGELQSMGFDVENDGDVRDLIKSYFNEDIQAAAQKAVARADKAARTARIKITEQLNKKNMRDLARALRLREIEAAKLVNKVQRILSKELPPSRTKKQIRSTTGMLKIGDIITESEALRRLMQREQAASQAGYRAGEKAGAEAQKVHDQAVEENRIVREAATAEINDMVKDIRKVAEHAGVMPVDYQDAVNELLNQYDLKKRSDKTLAKRDSARKYVQEMEDAGEEVNIPQEQLDMLEKVTLNDMTVDEFRQVHDTIMRLYTQGRLKNKLIAAKEERDFQATVEEGKKAIVGAEGIKEESDMARIIKDQNKGIVARTGESFQKFFEEHLRPEIMIHGLDGWKKGINTKVLWDPLFDAFVQRTESSAASFAKLQQILKPLDQKNAYTKKYDVGQFKGITKANMYKAYALSFNDKGYETLINSGFTEEDIAALDKALTGAEKLAIQELMRYYGEVQYPTLDAVYQKLNGAHMPKEENYFPIVNLESKEGLLKDAEAQLLMRSKFKVASVPSGMTKKRSAHTLGFQSMDFFSDVLKNWEAVEHYKAYAPVIRDARKYLGNPEIKAAITQKLGANYYDILQRFIRDVAYGGDQALLTERDKFVQRIRTNYMKAVLSLNFLSPIRQGLGFLPAMYMVGKANITGAAFKYLSNPGKWWAFTDNKSVLLKYRAFTSEREMKEIIARRSPEARLQKYSGATAITEYGMLPLIYADKVICQISWLGAYDSSIKRGLGEEEAVAFANEVVRRTQNMGEQIFLSDAFRGGLLDRIFTVFKNENNQNFNLNFENIMKSKAKEQGWGEFIDGVVLLFILPATLYGWTQRKRLQETAGEWLNDLAGQALGGIMYLGDMANAIGGKGDIQSNPVSSELSAVVKTFNSKKPQTKIDNALKAIAFYFGLPYVGLKRIATGQPFGRPAKSKAGGVGGLQGIYQ